MEKSRMNRVNKQRGIGIIKLIALIPVILIGLVILAFIFTLLNKAYWDYRVRQMCEKDGGVTVYKKVKILKGMYPNLISSRGVLIIPSENHAKSNDPFFSTYKSVELHNGTLVVFRSEQSIIRAKDKKELSLHVTYSRRGGDFPFSLSHPSYFGCGFDEKEINLLKSVITVKGE